MVTFLLSLALLVAGYFVYSKYVDSQFGAETNRKTPAYESGDGVDYVPLGSNKALLIQFLNIAGLGPIFGAIMGAMYGPVVFLWIVCGTLFAGAVHDYFSGMISLRHNGLSLPDWIGCYLGLTTKQFLRILIVILMIMVGAVFNSGPARILEGMTGGVVPFLWWVAIIFVYYIVATLFPIDKIIGRIYPVFGFALLFMALGVLGAILYSGHLSAIPELVGENWANLHPQAEKLPLFPMLFVTVACGAISGFHASQSPLMARCLKNEGEGRKVFFGAMVLEGGVALIWAAAGMCFFGELGGLHATMEANSNNAAVIVTSISKGYLGVIGSILALLGVVAAPITSADTGFRAARLIIADAFSIKQNKFKNRLLIAVPLFVACFVLLQINFDIIWRYFAWLNQSIAMFTLWAISVFLVNRKKNFYIALIPALFMTMVSSTYILLSKEGLMLPEFPSYVLGGVITVGALTLFWWKCIKRIQTTNQVNI